MVWNDTSGGQGIVQGVEADCGLGATGVTGNAALFKDVVRWGNIWNRKGASYAILAFDGHDFDDPGYTTAPTGTFAGATTRDYNFDSSYKMLKVKLVNVSYDGTNYVAATPFDGAGRLDISLKDPNVDSKFSQSAPQYDLTGAGFKLYPKFTAAEVSAGAKVYVEWFRSPREFATSGTDAYEPGFESQFHDLVQKGIDLEYAKIYKPEKVNQFTLDIYGNGGNIKGILKEMQEWYGRKQPYTRRMTPLKQDNR